MISIPQDVVGVILDYLHNDLDTLKTCATVSRSFLPMSRKHLFFSLHLDHPLKSQRLYDLLSIQLDIVNFIQELCAEDHGEEVWFAENDSLPRILRIMHRLKLLSLDASYSNPILTWDNMSNDFQSALDKLLQSPILAEIKIYGVDLPVSIITHFSHLRMFTLDDADFYDDSPGQSPHVLAGTLGQLEALEFRMLGKPLPAAMFSLTQKLRLLSIGTCDPDTLTVAKDVIQSSATSIHSVIWQYSSLSIAATVQLGIIHNLQFLLFTMTMSQGREKRYFNPDLVSVIKHFEDRAVTTVLKELTIAVNARRYLNYEDVVKSLASCQGWERLDSLLLDWSPALRKVYICVDIQDVDRPDADDELQIMMCLRLPQLAERGVLVAELRTLRELRDIAWSRSRLE